MAAQDARLRPFTFYGRLPKGVTNVELTKILVQQFSKQELGGVQDFGAGRFEIFFKNRTAVERFLSSPVVTVRDQEVRFEYRGSQAKVVRVLHYPNDQPDEALCRAIGVYGQVHSCSKESVTGFPGVWSGVRRMRVDMNRAVPNLVPLGRFTVQCEYEGVVRLCIRCGFPGHLAAACTTPQCRRCAKFGHEQCEEPCTKCSGDHAVSECTVRTFASVTQQSLRPAVQSSNQADRSEEQSVGASQTSSEGGPSTVGGGESAQPVEATSEEPAAASPKQAAAVLVEGPAAEAQPEVAPPVEEAPKPARRKRPRNKRQTRNREVNVSANDASDDELSRASHDTPAEKRVAVEGHVTTEAEDSSSSEDEMSADSPCTSDENPDSTDTSSQDSVDNSLPVE